MFALHNFRMLSPYVLRYVPRSLRVKLGQWIPHRGLQHLQGILAILDRKSKEIFYSKRAALNRGDKDVVLQVEEAKDILSILSTYSPHDRRLTRAR